jgi:hypothetical protein
MRNINIIFEKKINSSWNINYTQRMKRRFTILVYLKKMFQLVAVGNLSDGKKNCMQHDKVEKLNFYSCLMCA